MAEQIALLRRQLHDKVAKERRLVQELDAALLRADAEIHDEIEKLQARHLQRREAIFGSLVGLAKAVGTLPTPREHLERPDPVSIGHDPARRAATVADERPDNIEAIAEYTRELRPRR
jgi:hypothetical protein